MMRKLLIASVCTLVLFCGVFSKSYAEGIDFSFRNGIHFGDSKESVKEKEIDNAELSEDESHLWYTEISLSGIDDSRLSYMFENDQLIRITIGYDISSRNISKAKHDYELINGGLIRKYGEPVKNENDYIILPGGLFDRCESLIMSNTSAKNQAIPNKDMWIVPMSDGRQLIIEHSVVTYTAIIQYVLHTLEYQFYDPEMEITDRVDKDL